MTSCPVGTCSPTGQDVCLGGGGGVPRHLKETLTLQGERTLVFWRVWMSCKCVCVSWCWSCSWCWTCRPGFTNTIPAGGAREHPRTRSCPQALSKTNRIQRWAPSTGEFYSAALIFINTRTRNRFEKDLMSKIQDLKCLWSLEAFSNRASSYDSLSRSNRFDPEFD